MMGDHVSDTGALDARVERLEALLLDQQAEIERQRNVIDALRARVRDGVGSGPRENDGDAGNGRVPPDTARGAAPDDDQRHDRRSMLRHAGGLVAGTVAASAAAVALSAEPAAAASGSFDGNPAVLGQGTGGAGTYAIAGESVFGSGVSGSVIAAGEIGVFGACTGVGGEGVHGESIGVGVRAVGQGDDGIGLKVETANIQKIAADISGRVIITSVDGNDAGLVVDQSGPQSTGIRTNGDQYGVRAWANGAQSANGIAVEAYAQGLNSQGVTAFGETTGVVGSAGANGVGVRAFAADQTTQALQVVGRAVVTASGALPAVDVTAGGDNSIAIAAATAAAVGGEAVRGVGTGPTTVGVSGSGATGVKATSNTVNGTGLRAQAGLSGSIAGDFTGAKFGVQAAGTVAPLHLVPSASIATAPTTGAHVLGEVFCDSTGALWACVVAGTPGKWRSISGPATAGSLYLLATPARIYDSRPGTNPPTGIKQRLNDKQQRVLTSNPGASPNVPAGAVAVVLNVTVTGTNPGGFLALFKNGIPYPNTSTVSWSASNTTIANGAVVAVDASAQFKAYMEGVGGTDFLVDLVGYYV